MNNKMSVTLKMDQRLQMSQQLRQAITLLQYNTLDLKQLVQQYIDSNPLIEVEESDYEESDEKTVEETRINTEVESDDSYTNHYNSDWTRGGQYYEDDSRLENFTRPKSLREHLLDQTLNSHFNDVEQIIAESIIDAIDEHGFLSMPLEEIHQILADNQSISAEQVQHILSIIQTYEPLGVASKDIQECLLIQLKSLSVQGGYYQQAYQIIHHYYNEFCDHNVKYILKMMNMAQSDYNQCSDIIRHLNLHPGTQYSNDSDIYVEPELHVKKIKNKWQVFLADSILTDIKINKRYQEIIKKNKRHGSYQSMKQELDEAKALLTALKRRNETLLNVAKHIVELQSDFLDNGLTHMKPMNIVTVSEALNVHESTVSRITTGKYIATPRGVFELKYFFPSQVSSSTGASCSDIAVKAHMKEIIQHEIKSRPYSDADLVLILKQKGINLARRTVAKYREAMKILPSYQRGKVMVEEEDIGI